MASSPCDEAGEVYTPLIQRVLGRLEGEQARARADRAAAAARYDELMSLDRAGREAAIGADERFASVALAGRLLDACIEVRREDAEAGVELSRLALAVAGRLDPGRYGAGLVADLKARCWAYRGDALAPTDARAARDAFRRARFHLRRGSGDPLEEAEVLCLAAGLLDPPAGARAASGIH